MALYFIRRTLPEHRTNESQINGGLANGATELAAREALQSAMSASTDPAARASKVFEEWTATQIHSVDADGLVAPILIRGGIRLIG